MRLFRQFAAFFLGCYFLLDISAEEFNEHENLHLLIGENFTESENCTGICKEHEKCSIMNGQIECKCISTYSRNPASNDCEICEEKCSGMKVCSFTPKSFGYGMECICPAGYDTIDDECQEKTERSTTSDQFTEMSTKIQVKDCNANCGLDEECYEDNEQPKCKCKQDYVKDPVNDICILCEKNCSEFEECSILNEGYGYEMQCVCRNGYERIGDLCEASTTSSATTEVLNSSSTVNTPISSQQYSTRDYSIPPQTISSSNSPSSIHHSTQQHSTSTSSRLPITTDITVTNNVTFDNLVTTKAQSSSMKTTYSISSRSPTIEASSPTSKSTTKLVTSSSTSSSTQFTKVSPTPIVTEVSTKVTEIKSSKATTTVSTMKVTESTSKDVETESTSKDVETESQSDKTTEITKITPNHDELNEAAEGNALSGDNIAYIATGGVVVGVVLILLSSYGVCRLKKYMHRKNFGSYYTNDLADGHSDTSSQTSPSEVYMTQGIV